MKDNATQNIKSFIKDYKVAAFASSSKFLVKDVLREINSPLHYVVEHGAGDGVMSKELLKGLDANGKLVLVEQNKEFLQILRKINDPRVLVVEGYAQNYKYEAKPDLIISSIPFSFLNKKDREKVVTEAVKNLDKGGKFIIFHQYNLLMRSLVKNNFRRLKIKFVVRNLFPCFVIIGEN